MEKKYYTVYKTINLINNKFYIGIHGTNDINDTYLGSGFALKKALKKYGCKNFKKEILYIFDNKKDMILKEIEIIDDELINNPNSYNINRGGFGLITLNDEKRKKTILKIQKSMLNRTKEDKFKSIEKRKQSLLKIDKNIFKIIGKKSSEKQILNYKNGYINPNTNFTPIHIYDGFHNLKYTTTKSELKELCENNELPHRALVKSLLNHGEPLYLNSPPRSNENYNNYRFWYALYSDDERNDFQSELSKRGVIYNIIDNNGNIVLEFIDFIKYYCKRNGFPIESMKNSLKTMKPISSGKFKGYQLVVKDQLIYPNN